MLRVSHRNTVQTNRDTIPDVLEPSILEWLSL